MEIIVLMLESFLSNAKKAATVIVLFCTSFALSQAQSPTCDIAAINAAFQGAGYIPLTVQGQSCSLYFVNPTSQQAGSAQSAAETLGANLVVMNDAAENTNVSAALDASPYNGATVWIGYQRSSAGANTFFTSDGTTGPFVPGNGNPLIYQNWASGEPNNSGYGDTDWLGNCDWDCQNGEQCVQIYPGGQWNDESCDESSISIIEVNLCPEITVDVSANNVCAGNPITLTASTLLGSEPYQYLWSTSEVTPAITLTPAATTTIDVGVADRYSCTAQESIILTILSSPEATFDAGAAVCISEAATITYTGNAAAGATYVWDFGTGIVQGGSGQGPYQVGWATSGPQVVTLQVTENGCASPVESQNVTVSPSPTADFTFTVVCEDNPTDFTNTSVGNGGVILGSAWDFGGGNTEVTTDASYTFPSSGTYPVSLGVATADGCLAQVTQQITVNPGPTGVFSSTDINCFGACDGTAEVVVQGGVAPVTVSWSTGATGNTISGLCPGPVTGTVSDANGCEVTGQITIIEPDELTVSVTVTETTCAGVADGTVTDLPVGGTPPYQVDWAGEDPNALLAGSYSVTVTDANGCTAVLLYTIFDGVGLSLDFNITDNICFGGTDGEANLTVSNGSAPYDIVWSDAFLNVLQTNVGSPGIELLSNLGAGTYNVAVQDAIGCNSILAISIAQPVQGLVMNLTPQDLNCFESADGEIEAEQDGLSPFTYEVFDVFGNSLEMATAAGSYIFQGLEAGIHFVDITDDNGCTTTDALELFEPTPLLAESTKGPISCFLGSDGSIEITLVSGGTMPYSTIVWDDPSTQTGSIASNLSIGTYTATIGDANGCEIFKTFTLDEPPAMVLTPSYLTDTCGQGKGAAIVNAQLGTFPYTFLWKPDSVDLSIHENLHVGSYEVVVMDANGCKDSIFVDVTDDLPYPTAAFDYRIVGERGIEQEVQFINNSIGTIAWQWNFGNGNSSNEKDPSFWYSKAGDYLVQLLASNGFCFDTVYQYVNIDPLLTVYIPNAFTPGETTATNDGNNDYFFPQGEGIDERSYDMFIYDRWGKLVWQTGNFTKKWDGTHMSSLEPVPGGMYVYQITFREFANLDRHEYKGVVHVIRP